MRVLRGGTHFDDTLRRIEDERQMLGTAVLKDGKTERNRDAKASLENLLMGIVTAHLITNMRLAGVQRRCLRMVDGLVVLHVDCRDEI